MLGQPTCSDPRFGRVLAVRWGSKAEVQPWCRWQRGSGCIPRWDGTLARRKMQGDNAYGDACGKLFSRTSWEGRRKGRRDQKIYFVHASGPPVYLWHSMSQSKLILRELPNPWVGSAASGKSIVAQISALSCRLAPSVQPPSMSHSTVGSHEYRFPKHPLLHS